MLLLAGIRAEPVWTCMEDSERKKDIFSKSHVTTSQKLGSM